ncbi:MAG TPA: phosphodiester glycosidase family protein [Gemmatimonadaceae bacterium]|nr:phosphodiester glycosidase family protein [Gemmatimonadaceae bacterium]
MRLVARTGSLLLASACALGTRAAEREVAAGFALAAPPIVADSARVALAAPGVVHRYYWLREGPWAVHVLDVDREACWTLTAAKAHEGAVGREPTSAIVASQPELGRVAAGGINGDFFLLAPPGVPVGAHVEAGRVVAGPVARPVVLVDSAGVVRIDTLRAAGWLAAPGFGAEIVAWNRPRANGLTLFDDGWGPATDSATGALEVVISARRRGVVLALDTVPAGVAIPPGGAVLAVGRGAPAILRAQLGALRAGMDTVDVALALTPSHPREAVGGFPILLRGGREVPGLESAGGEGFGPVRHPRTAVGIGAGGRRLFLVVVDGRQPPYSDGMTLGELAAFMRALGADDALNLDGGGSTAMAVAARRVGGAPRVVNRPSDREGERAVANALVVSCER